ncbi:hypothetical protein [Kitasatospora sp. NPDC088548]|uniref:hypothetical protein n=1 Tax=Kitasatospora sp. NPDC088548 TaxID=3364075 RepID=UPI00382599E7
MTDVRANHVRSRSVPAAGPGAQGGQPAANGRPAAGPQGLHPGVWVTQAYPPVLAAALGRRGGIPVAVREAVLDQLRYRSPAALRERIERRWWADFGHLPAGAVAERADDIALALVAAPGCPDPRCEDGWLLDQDDAAGGCPRCRRRRIEVTLAPALAPPSTPEHQQRMAARIRDQIRTSRSTARHVRQPDRPGDHRA